MERMKHYLSICNAAPSERLSIIALENRQAIIARNNAIIDENLPKWDAFFDRFDGLFEWQRPDGSCMGFPRYLGAEGVEEFCRRLVEEAGVLLLPSTIYRSEVGPSFPDRFRLGYGRRASTRGLRPWRITSIAAWVPARERRRRDRAQAGDSAGQ